MAERDQTLVSITLDRKRPYHIGDDERNVVWVGPGACEVPAWVAEHWGAIPAPAVPPTPAIPPDAVTATVETVVEHELETVETVQTFVPADPLAKIEAPTEAAKFAPPAPPVVPRQPFAGLGLTTEQQAALVAAGYGDRAALAAALEAAGDRSLGPLSRSEVRRLRKQLEG